MAGRDKEIAAWAYIQDTHRRVLVIHEAIDAAAQFAEEFPGETISGDWDSEAFALSHLPPETWELYSETLHAEIRRLAATLTLEHLEKLAAETARQGDPESAANFRRSVRDWYERKPMDGLVMAGEEDDAYFGKCAKAFGRQDARDAVLRGIESVHPEED